MQSVEGANLVAVGSRSRERAQAFADRFGIGRAYGEYETLAEDPQLDVVYVATPHARHDADARLFLSNGKHVLCEKPFTLNAAQAKHVIRTAIAHGRFVMEAMWSRFLPAYESLVDRLRNGQIGEPLMAEADLGWRIAPDPEDRHFDLERGGGALLDLGVYPLQLCSLVFGSPDAVSAQGKIGTTGVDEQVAAVLHYESGGLGVVKAAIRTPMSCTARITGTEGAIDLPAFMHCPDHITVVDSAGERRIDAGFDGEGLRFEVEEVHRCVRAGLLESPRMPWRETVAIATVLDAIRDHIGLRYPGE